MKKMNRRSFLKTGAIITGTTWIASQLPFKVIGFPNQDLIPDIATVSLSDPLADIEKLLNSLGGLGKIIPEGSTIGVLVNSPWKHPGYYTNPDIALSVVKLCRDHGAAKVICFKPVPDGYWARGKYSESMQGIIKDISYGIERTTVPVTGGKNLQNAEIFKDFLDVDVYISIPVAKHHNGTIFSGNLKGLMGVSSSPTNRLMHSPDGKYTYDNHEHLAQCIADLNLLRKPDMCIVDATICALNNGPAGPGEIVEPGKILAGKDPVALDVYSSKLIGFDPDEILTFRRSYEHGLGEIDPGKLYTKEL